MFSLLDVNNLDKHKVFKTLALIFKSCEMHSQISAITWSDSENSWKLNKALKEVNKAIAQYLLTSENQTMQ